MHYLWHYELSPWVRTGHPWHIQIFSAGSIFTSSCILTWQRGSMLIHPPACGYMQLSSTYTRAECQTLQEFLPTDHHQLAPLTASMPLREATNIKDLPSPSKSLSCRRSRTTCLQTKKHLWQGKGIYCLSFEEFCTQETPVKSCKHANVHITYTIGSRRKDPEGAVRCPHMAVLAATWA